MNLHDLKIIENKENSHKCKGLFFRGYDSTYFSGDRLEHRQGIRFLKSKSCKKGCCDYLWEYINDTPEEVAYLDTIETGGLYELKIIDFTRDRETGYMDDYTVGIVKIEENNDKKSN